MPCDASLLKSVPLFALLDDEETAVLASQVELRTFASRERIYKLGAPGGQAYVMVTGKVRVSTVDEDGQEVVVDEPSVGEIFGFASMLEQSPHQTNAVALEESSCLEIDRHDITVLLERKPHAGMDLLTVLGRQIQRHHRERSHLRRAHRRCRRRLWRFMDLHFDICDRARRLLAHQRHTRKKSVGSLPIHSVESLPVDVGRNSSSGDHDESEPSEHARSAAK